MPGRPYKILIIEDSEADRNLYKEYLDPRHTGHRYIFIEAGTGEEGLALYEKESPDCVLLDYMLPDVTGWHVLDDLSKQDSILPVVILTGQGNEEIAVGAITRGAQDYLPKRILTASGLQRAVDNTIHKAVMMRKIARQNDEIKIARDRAEREEQKALAASKAKSEFLAAMSHEIRTPMNGIIGMTELLLRSPLNDEQRHNIETIQSSGDILLKVINDILDFSKIEAGQMEIEKKPIFIEEACTDVIELLTSHADDKGIDLIFNAPKTPLPEIISDPLRLRQILINLIGNAVKFTKSGHVILDVTEQQKTKEHVNLRFEIHDTGIGISPDTLPMLFQPFTQADSSTTRKYGGTGLGLVICKRLVEAMHGTIHARSIAGKGSTFWFDIPFSIPQVTSHRKKKTAKRLHDKVNFKARILVAEDDRTSQHIIRSILQELGCQTHIVDDGNAVFKALQADPAAYDLVFMDCQMPEVDGFNATRHIRSQEWGKDIKIIFLTANALQGDREKCLAAGAQDYITKPVRIRDVRRIMEKFVPLASPEKAA